MVYKFRAEAVSCKEVLANENNNARKTARDRGKEGTREGESENMREKEKEREQIVKIIIVSFHQFACSCEFCRFTALIESVDLILYFFILPANDIFLCKKSTFPATSRYFSLSLNAHLVN